MWSKIMNEASSERFAKASLVWLIQMKSMFTSPLRNFKTMWHLVWLRMVRKLKSLYKQALSR